METQTNWRAHAREENDPPARPIFPGRPIDEQSAAEDQSWASSFDEYARQMPDVPDYVKTVAIAAIAAGTGVAVGYWLGGRQASRRRSAFSFSNADFSDFAKLAPEAAHLLKNPLVRAFAVRMLARQVSRYLAA